MAEEKHTWPLDMYYASMPQLNPVHLEAINPTPPFAQLHAPLAAAVELAADEAEL